MSWLKRVRQGLGKIRQPKVIPSQADISERDAFLEGLILTPNLEENLKVIKDVSGNSSDLIIRRFKVGPNEVPGAIVYIDGLASTDHIERILDGLLLEPYLLDIAGMDQAHIYKTAVDKLVASGSVNEVSKIAEVFDAVIAGDTIILFAGTAKGINCATRDWPTRQVEESDQEAVIRGPRDGFVESIRINTALLRRKIKTPFLWIENLKVGALTKTDVSVVYIKGLADDSLVEEVKKRIGKIAIDGVLESGYIEEFLEDQPLTVFPLLYRTERPDWVAACLLEGRVIILTDGTPFALILPVELNMGLMAPDDYYERMPIGSFIRSLRVMAFSISIFLPGLYVAVLNFHPELLPTTLFLRITGTREGVPFPVVFEALIMEGLFELLREAGIRLPQAIGSAISIVGALILGDAAISAGLVSPAMVIVIGITAIASFATPVFSVAIAARLIRFLFIILGAIFGLFGIQIGILLLVIHLCALRSFGSPYFSPYAPLVWQNLKDSFVRVSWRAMLHRPKGVGRREPGRQQKMKKLKSVFQDPEK